MEVPHVEKYGGPVEKRVPTPEERKKELEEDKEAILKLEGPVEAILSRLREGLEKGSYSVLLSDDVSGRVPVLLLDAAVSDIYEAKGFKHPEVRFVTGSTGLKNRGKEDQELKTGALDEYIGLLKKSIEEKRGSIGKVLIVTDTIDTGESVKTMLDSVRASGWDADIVAIGMITFSDEDRQDAEEFFKEDWHTNVVIGSGDVPSTYSRKPTAGVQKDKINLHSSRAKDYDGQRVQQARILAKQSGHQLATEFLDKKD